MKIGPKELALREQRSVIARDLRTPKYKPRVVPDSKKAKAKAACRKPIKGD